MTGINQFENFSLASVVLGNAAPSKISGKSTRLTGDIASDFSNADDSAVRASTFTRYRQIHNSGHDNP